MYEYEMGELVPIVAELSKKYTSGESTSISYEKAQQLMEAVLYCLAEIDKNSEQAIAITKGQRLTAELAYKIGYKLTEEKVKKTYEKYQKLMDIFFDYKNQNLYETAVKGITGFFQYYDLQFAPQNTIITMDYPTLYRDFSLTGIDAIAKYVDELYLEQIFLQSIPRQYVLQILQEYDVDYRKAFYNISTIIVRHFVAKAVVKSVVKGMQREDEVEIDEILWRYARQSTLDSLENTFLHMFGELVKTICEEEWIEDIKEYYAKDIKEFALELQQVKDSQYIKNVVV